MTVHELGRRAYLRRVGGVAGIGLVGGATAGGTVGASAGSELGIESVPRARPILLLGAMGRRFKGFVGATKYAII